MDALANKLNNLNIDYNRHFFLFRTFSESNSFYLIIYRY